MLVDKLAVRLGSVEAEGLVFTAERGGPLRSSSWRRSVWMPALHQAHIDDLRIHDMRHTAASLMISSGASIKVVQRRLGHASATMTLDLYGHLYEDELDALANALDRKLADSPAPPARPQRALGGDGAVVPIPSTRP